MASKKIKRGLVVGVDGSGQSVAALHRVFCPVTVVRGTEADAEAMR